MTARVEDFSLALGGPLYQRWLQPRRRQPTNERVLVRMLALPAFAWLPMLLLAAWSGHLTNGVVLPFLTDLDAQSRLLGALPLLLGTEILVHGRIRRVVGRFVEHGVIPAAAMPRFEAILDSAQRWRNSLAVEIALLVLSFTFGHWLWQTQLRPDVATWYASTGADGTELTPAGMWYAWVGLPMLRFLLFRWYFRLVVWYRLLWQVSRLPLDLCTLHPDRTGGLGFVRDSLYAFVPLLLAHTVPLAGLIATRITHTGAQLLQFQVEVAATLGWLLALVSVPLLFFHGPLVGAKQKAAAEHGRLVMHLTAAFRQTRDREDLASLADLGRTCDASERMRTWLVARVDLVRIVVAVAVPLLPLLLFLFPFEELVRRALDVFF